MRYKVEFEGEDGWTQWIQPKHTGYKLRCCDCALVHDMEFRVVRDDQNDPLVDPEKIIKGLVVFRVKRDARATAACRRKR